METKKPVRDHRAVFVTGAGMGINLILGVLYSWGVVSAALIDDHGWTATETQLPFMVACALFAFFMIPGGRLQDRFGPRPVLIVTAVLSSLGFFLSGLTLSLHGMTIFYGLIFGISMGLGYSATTPPAIKWFSPSRRGLISGIVVSGFGLAPLYIAPLKTFLIDHFGLQTTFYILAAFFFAVIIVFAQVIKNPPEGYICNEPKKAYKKNVCGKDYRLKEVLATSQFYILWIMFCLGTFAGLLIIGQLAKIGLEQSGITTSFLLIGIYSLFNFLGRLFWGVVSDRIGRRQSLFWLFLIQVVVYAFFSYLSTPVTLIIAIAAVGLTFGGMLTVFPVITADYYGMKNFGLIYGFVFSAWGVGGILGPLVGGIVRDTTGTYTISYIASASLSFIGMILSLVIKNPGSSGRIFLRFKKS